MFNTPLALSGSKFYFRIFLFIQVLFKAKLFMNIIQNIQKQRVLSWDYKQCIILTQSKSQGPFCITTLQKHIGALVSDIMFIILCQQSVCYVSIFQLQIVIHQYDFTWQIENILNISQVRKKRCVQSALLDTGVDAIKIVIFERCYLSAQIK